MNSWNTDMGLGIQGPVIQGGTNGLLIALSEIVILGLVILYPLLYRGRSVLTIGFGLGLVVGGAIGNLIDRVTLGYVTDLIYINYLPVFNLADLSIFSGCVILALSYLRAPRTR